MRNGNAAIQNILSIPVYRVQLVPDGRRFVRPVIDTADDAAEIFLALLAREDREHVVTLMLNAQNGVLGIHTVSIGTLTCTAVSAREVFKAAILANAAAIVVGHNHPSGDPTPSPEDRQITHELRAAGKILDIPLLDHVIVGEWGAFRCLKPNGEFGPLKHLQEDSSVARGEPATGPNTGDRAGRKLG
jgi:DNA repair protein RadC